MSVTPQPSNVSSSRDAGLSWTREVQRATRWSPVSGKEHEGQHSTIIRLRDIHWEIYATTNYTHCPVDAGEPARFFAEAYAEDDHTPFREHRRVYVYVTPDEGLHGRLATITHGKNLATFIMLSDNRVTGQRLGSILLTLSNIYTDRRMVAHYIHWDPRNPFQREITLDANTSRFADKTARNDLRSALAYAVGTWSTAASSVPDMAKIFDGAPAPVRAFNALGLVTFAGGSVAVVDVTHCEKFHRLMGYHASDDEEKVLLRDVVTEIGVLSNPGSSAATCRVLVAQTTQISTGLVDTQIRWMDGVLHVLVTGTSLAQVAARAHTVYEAIGKSFAENPRNEYFYDYRDDCHGMEFLADVVDAKAIAEEARAASRRRAAGDTITRVVAARMDALKARLWHPTGRLAAKLAAYHSEH